MDGVTDREWLQQTVAEAYHGADGTNPHHDFAECGDPFCKEAQERLASVLAKLDAEKVVA